MNEQSSDDQKPSTYTASPAVPAELAPRLAVILQVLSGEKSVSEAARQLNLSRNHFQSILHQSLGAMIDTLKPKEPGRPPKSAAMSALQQRLRKLERENSRLKKRVEATNELITVAGELLHGRRTPGQRRTRKKSDSGTEADEEPEPRVRVLKAVDRMHALGLTLSRACWLAGIDASTRRRWRGSPPRRARQQPGLADSLRQHVEALLQDLHGLIGAAAMSHAIGGLSRRAAARLKAETLTRMERERKCALSHVRVSAPTVMRGLDAMHVRTVSGSCYALIAADAAVPYRTSVEVAARYDAALVARLIERDIERHGAPLVLRADRARAHEAPEVRRLLEQHHVLLLHGPPRYPRFYGQLERQNREHRAWLDALIDPAGEPMQQLLERMLYCLNTLWPRRNLHWCTAAEIWDARKPIGAETRGRFLNEVNERTQRLACKLNVRGAPADLPQRLAIEQTLTNMGYLQLQMGRRC